MLVSTNSSFQPAGSGIEKRRRVPKTAFLKSREDRGYDERKRDRPLVCEKNERVEMRKSLKTRAGIFPMPVLLIATYNDDGTVDVMNAAWGTMIENDIVGLNLSATHQTTHNIKNRKAFTISMADAAHVKEADYFGCISGKKDPKKFENSGLHAERSSLVDAPVITEFPLCMECEFITYEDGEYGIGVVGKVVNVTADESVMDGDTVNMDRVNAIAFDSYTNGYYKVQNRVGNAFSDGLAMAREFKKQDSVF